MTVAEKNCSIPNRYGLLGRWAPLNQDEKIRSQRVYEHELLDEKEKKVRIALCVYALLGLTLCQMSKMILNVSIVEMVHDSNYDGGSSSDELLAQLDGSCHFESQIKYVMEINSSKSLHASNKKSDSHYYETEDNSLTTTTASGNIDKNCSSLDCPKDIEDESVTTITTITTTLHDSSRQPSTSAYHGEFANSNELASKVATESPLSLDTPIVVYPKFDWSSRQQNLLLGAFYIGYAPFMILGGFLAEKYGNKYFILLSVAGSSLVNFLTPILASYSFELLVLSRIMLGVMQAAIFPALYDLFAKWLTMTETSIFAPMIKVAFSMGILIGSLLPGVIISLELGWPLVFYVSGFVCLLWTLVWFFISNSSPQESRFVRQPELNRIMRKKNIISLPNCRCCTLEKATDDSDTSCSAAACLHDVTSLASNAHEKSKQSSTSKDAATPWRLILTSPSVLSLILVKFTYQLCLDFAAIELASYLKNAFHAPVEIISAITVVMFAIHVLFMVFVGIVAKNMVRNKTFGWSKTTTRKVFQGLANFTMAIMYVLMSLSNCNITMVAILLQVIAFVWMFGAGGETMMPYDLSEKYPATIVGIAHSSCGISGLVMALITGQILGDRGNDNARWNLLLRLVAGASFVGGLVFTLVAEAEPIEGKQPKQLAKNKETASEKYPNQGKKTMTGCTKVYFSSHSLRPDDDVFINAEG